MSKFFVIHLSKLQYQTEGKPLRGSPLSLTPKTRKEALSAIAWQAQGGFDPQDYIIASVVSELPGVMEYVPSEEPVNNVTPVLVENDGFTLEAWKKFLTDTWGQGTS